MAEKNPPDFFGNLNRPQYVPTPEVLLSSLAWACVPRGPLPTAEDGIVYRLRGKGQRSPLETSPTRDEGRLRRLQEHVGQTLGQMEQPAVERASAVIAEQLESRARKQARYVGILPLNLSAALMQDTSGVLGVANPPNFAAIIQKMFRLGGGSDETAADLLLRLYGSTGSSDSAMEWLASCIEAMAPPEIVGLAQQADGSNVVAEGHQPAWLRGVNTPFRWFHDAWTSLCTGGWYEAMPRRRWVDWATCVLRTGLGVGFLYEMSFYYRLVLELTGTGDPADAARLVSRPDRQLLRWDPGQSTSKRDVTNSIQQLCHKGSTCRNLLIEWQSLDGFPRMADSLADENGLRHWLAEARAVVAAKPDLRDQRKQALAIGKTPTGKNMLETVNGSIVGRTGQQGWVDGYSLLRKRGNRYSVVDPGQDWLGVVASLGGKRAGRPSRVSTLLTDLDAMGLRPGYRTIVEYLERAGLARSSHDADDAIEIAAAF